MSDSLRDRWVFLNVPFDSTYEPLFVALVAGLTGLGRTPHCVLEIAEHGQGRPTRILRLIKRCRASIHDLSRVQLSGGVPRFNMPFELGLAIANQRLNTRKYHVFIFEGRSYRLPKTLSDLGGHDHEVHRGSQIGILDGLLNWLGQPSGTPSIAELRSLTRDLAAVVSDLKRKHRAIDCFRAHIFRQTVAAATMLARRAELIR